MTSAQLSTRPAHVIELDSDGISTHTSTQPRKPSWIVPTPISGTIPIADFWVTSLEIRPWSAGAAHTHRLATGHIEAAVPKRIEQTVRNRRIGLVDLVNQHDSNRVACVCQDIGLAHFVGGYPLRGGQPSHIRLEFIQRQAIGLAKRGSAVPEIGSRLRGVTAQAGLADEFDRSAKQGNSVLSCSRDTAPSWRKKISLHHPPTVRCYFLSLLIVSSRTVPTVKSELKPKAISAKTSAQVP